MDPDRPDRAWMRMNRADKAYHIEVDKFIEAAKKHAAKTKSVGILCPCKVYKNEQIATEDKTIRSHLIINGFVKDYHTWIYHGEKKITYEFISDDDEDIDEDMPLKARGNYFDAVDNNEGVQHNNEVVFEGISAGSSGDLGDDADNQDGDELEEMLKHFVADVILRHAKELEHLEVIKDAARQSVYVKCKGCPKHWSQLCFVIELLVLKAKYGWSDSSFYDLWTLLAWLLPKPNLMPENTYKAKKVIGPLTMGVERIHACPNHCILYTGKEFKDLDKCPKCGVSRYKNNEVFTRQDDPGPAIGKKRKKGSRKNVHPQDEVQTCLGIDENQRRIPALVMCYLNPIDRLRRLFANPREAKLMRWWYERAKDDENLAHPADGTQWKKFDEMYPEFARDPRNVRFALSTDGMNSFGDRSSTHSTWAVILTIYNLPTWLCQKQKYLLLCIMIQGPK